MIPYGKHQIDRRDVDAVVDVLEQRFLTQGDRVPEFERALCAYTGARHGIAVNSGTSGLHIACLALGVGTGDSLWTSPNSFVASANCGLYCGASVDFVDIDPHTRNLSIPLLAQKLARADASHQLPKVLVVVHFAGMSCDMQAIGELCRSYGVAVIEDAAHALGGQYAGGNIGNCAYSDITVTSFHPVKSITSAEGGMVLTNDAVLASRMRLFASHGITKDPVSIQGHSHGDWYYQQQCLGFNYRLSDLHAALGLSQLDKLDEFIARRRQLAGRYFKGLCDLPLKLPRVSNSSAWHLFVVELTKHDRRVSFDALRDRGVGVNVHYIPIHLQPVYQALGFAQGDFPAAEAYYQNAITLPLYPGLTDKEQDKVIGIVREVLS